ncbi:MAG: SDR family oxidoreductase [Armatimonadetes bacterium]|nr:SDR family oxidoreductase [Armatimonadota bacterium]
MATIFLTGYPGFLGSELLPRILARKAGARALCLVQSKFLALAEQRRQLLFEAHPGLEGRIELVEGDITRPGLGLPANGALRENVEEVYHLAALYDLGLSRHLGMRINVDGTRHTLDFASDCPGLKRFHYVSTCYVSGRHCGIYTEQDLDRGQPFNNYYEETKFLAEIEVQSRMRGGLPTTIYRPSIVTGDSHSGATQKFDGPYFFIQWLLRQPRMAAVMPVVGDPTATRVNLVPRDYVTDAMAYLSGLEQSASRVYQLADPEPLTADRLIDEVARATERHIVRVPVPLGVTKAALRHLPAISRLVRIPPDVVDYFSHPTHYTTDNTTADLKGSGIELPRLTSYLHRLVHFMRENPQAGMGAMA